MSLRPCMLLFVPLLGSAPMVAAEAAFGAQAHLAKPMGTFSNGGHLDNRIGLGLGIQVPVDFGAGHVLRPRLDFMSFSRNSGDIRYKTDSVLLLADYNYYVAEERDGAYLIAGIGLHSTRLDATKPVGPLKANGRMTTTGFAYNVGLGYAFNRNVAMELRYQGMDMGALNYNLGRAGDSAYMANSLVGSIGFTF